MKIIVSFICIVLSVVSLAQDSIKPSIELGIRSQKYTGFYTVNGITAEYRLVKSNKKIQINYNSKYTDAT